jgi:hypothetical protein
MTAVPCHRLKSGKVPVVPALVLSAFALVSGSGVVLSELPRLPSIWSHPYLMNFESLEYPAAIQDGIFLGLDRGPLGGRFRDTSALVALDLENGMEMWRAPLPKAESEGPDRVVFAGDKVLIRGQDTTRRAFKDVYTEFWRPKRTIALELRTGKRRWARTLPAFEPNLEIWRGAEREIGLGHFQEMKWIDERYSHGIRKVMAVDLHSGDSLWQLSCEWGGCVAAAGPDAFYLAISFKEDLHYKRLLTLDPVSGNVRRSFSLPLRLLRSFHVFGPRSDRALLVGDITLALSLEDGRILWRLPREVPPSENPEPEMEKENGRFIPDVRITGYKPDKPPRAEWRDGRLFLVEIGHPWAKDRIREVSVETGRDIGVFDLPADLKADFGRMHILAGPGSLGLTVIPEPSGSSIAIRYERPGAKPRLFAVNEKVIAAEGGVVLAYALDGTSNVRMEGHAAFDEAPAEADAMDPPRRVRTILNHTSWYPGIAGPRNLPALEALRMVPGWAGMLADMARDTADPLRRQAIGAAIGLDIPDLAGLLRAEISRPLPPLRPVRENSGGIRGWNRFFKYGWKRFLRTGSWSYSEPLPGTRDDGTAWVDDRFEGEYRLRGHLIMALAELDDPQSTPLLTSMLFDSESPTGYTLTQMEKFGVRERWPYGNRNRIRAGSKEYAFSHCLQSPGGRPDPHAAAYRSLARMGRPADLAALRRFDAETFGAGGWAHLCDGDDLLRNGFHERAPLSNGLGLCNGWDVGNIRITQAEAIWLRQRRSGGAWGPPAWAFDPGGDTLLHRPVLTSVRRLDDGKIRIEGRMIYSGDHWNTTIDPRIVFADEDGDGLTDGTETALGTDPDGADTDSDGIPDGMDPAPKATPARTDSGRVQDEVVRYLTVFAKGGPVGLYADTLLWSGGGGARGAGVIVHWPRLDGDGTDCKENGGCNGRKPGPYRHSGIRRCEEPLAIRSIRMEKDTAYVGAAWWNPDGHRIARGFQLAKVDGDWRIVREKDGEGSMEKF